MSTAPMLVNRHTGQQLHLGWKPTPKERLKRVPQLHHYYSPMHAGVLPAEWDYSDTALTSFLTMLGNNKVGDCSIAAVLKQCGLTSANRPDPKELVSNDTEALTQYPVICGPGDQGCYVPDVLDYWMKTGLTCGGVVTKIAGYAQVDVNNPLLLATALYLTGSLHGGLMITQNQYQNAAPDAVWDVDTSPVIGGHSIPLAGRKSAGFRFGTWAMRLFITQAALQAPYAQAEVFAVFDSQWFNKDGWSAHGFNVAQLHTAFAALQAGTIPPIPDPVSPPPAPGPIVPPVDPPGPAPAGGALTAQGTVNFFGNNLPVTLTGTVSAPASTRRRFSWWALAKDVSAIISDGRNQNWPAVATDVEKLLTYLGVVLPAEAHMQLMNACRNRFLTLPATDPGA